jgi:hypothetical protein
VTKIFAVKHFQHNIEQKKLYKGGYNADAFVVAKAAVIEGTVVTKDGLFDSELDGLGMSLRPVPPSSPEFRWDSAPLKGAFSVYQHAKAYIGPLSGLGLVSIALQSHLL